ncbi:MAG TPA: 50S ribosomal protein L23 [bacterium]|nr:50S ribosomal protein L23 [bacterium]
MSLSIYHIIKRPVITEKSTQMDESLNKVVFEVDRRATKTQVRDAVEKLFKVKVLSVNSMRLRGKPIRRGHTFSNKSNRKKVIVTLRPGDRIDFYEGA